MRWTSARRTCRSTRTRRSARAAIPGATAYTDNLLRPYRATPGIEQNLPDFYDTYHSMQFSLNRRFPERSPVRRELHVGHLFEGNTGLQRFLQHSADGKVSVSPANAKYEELMKTLDPRPHFLKANAVWSIRAQLRTRVRSSTR